jgi:putative cell wall-binding protein
VLAVAMLAGLTAPAATAAATAPPTWAPADRATIHPGVQTVTAGGQCTSNFVFYDAADVYLGQAAHCAGTGAATETDGCDSGSLPLGTPVDVRGAAHPAMLVYSSWLTMQARKETNGNACAYNDFALVRLDRRDHGRVNPTVPHFGGPTGIVGAVPTGATVYSYGNSSLRLGLTVLSPKRGVSLGQSAGGWNHTVYTATPGIPGDSGSGFLDSQGRAFGVLSTVAIAPLAASNGVADLALALDYLDRFGGLAVTLARGTEPFSPGLLLGGSGGGSDDGDDDGDDAPKAVAMSRVAGPDRYATAVAVSRGFASSDIVVIATGEAFVDALAAGPAAARLGAPLLLAAPSGLTEPTRTEIDRLGATRGVIVGGPAAVPTVVETQLRQMGLTVDRVSGRDRWETAVRVADAVFAPGTPVVVASGVGFADALAAAPLAGRHGAPLVLAAPSDLPAATADLLRRWGPPAVTIVGGRSAVSDATAQRIAEAAGTTPERLSGADRYATAAAVAAAVLADPAYDFAGAVWAASGTGFADALAAGPAVFRERGLLLLVPHDGDLPAAVRDVAQRSDGDRVRILGGTAAVSDRMAAQVKAAVAG